MSDAGVGRRTFLVAGGAAAASRAGEPYADHDTEAVAAVGPEQFRVPRECVDHTGGGY